MKTRPSERSKVLAVFPYLARHHHGTAIDWGLSHVRFWRIEPYTECSSIVVDFGRFDHIAWLVMHLPL